MFNSIDLETSFSAEMSLPHLTTYDRITMKEVEPLPRLQDPMEFEVLSTY